MQNQPYQISKKKYFLFFLFTITLNTKFRYEFNEWRGGNNRGGLRNVHNEIILLMLNKSVQISDSLCVLGISFVFHSSHSFSWGGGVMVFVEVRRRWFFSSYIESARLGLRVERGPGHFASSNHVGHLWPHLHCISDLS